jgi:Lrp/AsnC family transcriptional regulator
MDDFDRRILAALQEDAGLSNTEIAERVGLSLTPCWRRIRNLEESGVIRRRVALLDRHKLNVGVTVFVTVRTNQHNQDWFERFARAVQSIPEVVEFYRMAGDVDYMLRVVVPDIAAYDGVYKRLIEQIDLYDVSSSFAMEELKYTTAVPLNYMSGRKAKASGVLKPARSPSGR